MEVPAGVAQEIKGILDRLPKSEVPSAAALEAVTTEISGLVADPGSKEYKFLDWLICEVYIRAMETGANAILTSRRGVQVNIF